MPRSRDFRYGGLVQGSLSGACDMLPMAASSGGRMRIIDGRINPAPAEPDKAAEAYARKVWAEKACAPLVLEGPALVQARAHFLRRAAELGHKRSRHPALRVLAGGRKLAVQRAGKLWQVALPPGTTEVRLASRTWVPAHMRPADNDTRVLGVAIAHLALDGREVALDSPALAEGWNAPEPDWRWTDGGGVVPVAGARLLAFEVVMTGDYWLPPPG
jgi:hypothetical protein